MEGVIETQPDADPIRLLVCEDDEPLADGLCRNLELEGFSVHRVGTGEDALVLRREQARQRYLGWWAEEGAKR